MQFIFKDQITDKLLFVIQRFELALKRTSDVADCDDLLRTPEGVDLFDATCMRIQTIGEALKQIDTETKEKLLVYYWEFPDARFLPCEILFLMNICLLTRRL